MHTKQKYLFKNILVFTVSSLVAKLLSFFFVPLYTSILSEAEYGYFDLIANTSTLLVYVFTLNICDSVVRFTIEGKESPIKILAFAFKILALGSTICLILIISINLTKLLSWPTYLYSFLYLFFVASSLNGILLSYARGLDEIKKVAFSGVLVTLVTILSNILFLVVLDIHLFGYLLSALLGTLSSIAYLWISLHITFGKILFTGRLDKSLRKKMIKYSLPLIFNGIAWWLNSAFDRYSISIMEGIDENGLYSAATKIPVILATANIVFGQAWNLSSIKDIDEKDRDGFFSNTYNMYNCVLVTVGSGLIGLNIPISMVLLSKNFFTAWRFSSILIVSIIFNALSTILGGAFTRTMKTGIYAKTSIASTIINILLNIILIQWLGTIGAAIATTISFAFLWIIRFIIVKRYVILKADIIKHVISYIIMIAQILYEHSIERYSIIQLLCTMIILLLYRKEIYSLVLSLLDYLKGMIHKNKK